MQKRKAYNPLTLQRIWASAMHRATDRFSKRTWTVCLYIFMVVGSAACLTQIYLAVRSTGGPRISRPGPMELPVVQQDSSRKRARRKPEAEVHRKKETDSLEDIGNRAVRPKRDIDPG